MKELRALAEAADPNGSVTVTVGWLRAQLGEDGPAIERTVPEAPAEVDLTVAQVAALFGRGASTVRTWIAAGEFPNAYRLHGREWRITRADVAALQQRQRTARACVPKPASVTTAEPDLASWRQHLPKAS